MIIIHYLQFCYVFGEAEKKRLGKVIKYVIVDQFQIGNSGEIRPSAKAEVR